MRRGGAAQANARKRRAEADEKKAALKKLGLKKAASKIERGNGPSSPSSPKDYGKSASQARGKDGSATERAEEAPPAAKCVPKPPLPLPPPAIAHVLIAV